MKTSDEQIKTDILRLLKEKENESRALNKLMDQLKKVETDSDNNTASSVHPAAVSSIPSLKNHPVKTNKKSNK